MSHVPRPDGLLLIERDIRAIGQLAKFFVVGDQGLVTTLGVAMGCTAAMTVGFRTASAIGMRSRGQRINGVLRSSVRRSPATRLCVGRVCDTTVTGCKRNAPSITMVPPHNKIDADDQPKW